MDLGIGKKKALVTGGGRGLGRAIAVSLANEGTQIALVSRTQSDLDSFSKEFGSSHMGLRYDLMEDGAPAKMADHVIAEFGHPDIVIHNVGGNMDISDPFCSVEDWRKIYRFNLEIGVELNLKFVPEMQKRRWGRVVHISSIAGLENQGTVPYCSMKAALIAYTRSFGRFVSADGVCVSTVLPGAVFTEGGYWDKTLQTRPQHVEKYLNERMAIKRFGKPAEIGDVVAFLCSEQASFIVGSSFLVDGGQGRSFQIENS